MNCPFCNTKMKKIVQPGYEPAGIPDKVYYDHPSVNNCPHGSPLTQFGYAGHTKSESGWQEYHREIISLA